MNKRKLTSSLIENLSTYLGAGKRTLQLLVPRIYRPTPAHSAVLGRLIAKITTGDFDGHSAPVQVLVLFPLKAIKNKMLE